MLLRNRVRMFRRLLAAVLLFQVPVWAQDDPDDVVEVTVTGDGLSIEAAKMDALRKALEQAGKLEISSHSNTQDFALVRDTIYARAEGVVTGYRHVTSRTAADGATTVTLLVKVSKKAVASKWGEVQNVLDQVGRPGVTVFISERIDGRYQDSSILESQIEKRLLDVGFTVFAGEQVRRIAREQTGGAGLSATEDRALSVARHFGTQLLITGNAQAHAAGIHELAGQLVPMYNGDATVKVYYGDTGQLLASESVTGWRGGARGYKEVSPQAGKKALENAGVELVDRCYRSVMKHWARQISAGSDLYLRVEGISTPVAIKIKKMLAALDPDRIGRVNFSITTGSATFRMKSKIPADQLVERLLSDEWAALIQVTGLEENLIRAKKPE